MIRDFEPPRPLDPEDKDHLQWRAAVSAGLIPGLILLVVPGGSPWSSVTLFSRVIMGRIVPDVFQLSLGTSIIEHLILSIIYGLIVSIVVRRATQWRAIMGGALCGIVLYVINLLVVSLWIPRLLGNEGLVLYTHIFFGALAAGAYRGLLRRTPVPSATA